MRRSQLTVRQLTVRQLTVRQLAVGAMAAVLLLGACGTSSSNSTSADTANDAADGTIEWPRPPDQHALIIAADMPAMDAESFVVHWHAHLDVFVNKDSVVIPANLGIDEVDRKISPLHTHDDSGVLHIEAPDTTPLSLGQLFTVWGVRLDANCVADYCSPDTPIATYVDGEEFAGNPADLVLKDLQQISLVVGTPPRRIPDTYGDF
jgi:hypothetical protein